MALTKSEARGLIRELMDDASSKLWSDTLLDRLTTTTLDAMWGGLLEFAPQLTSQLDTVVTLAAPGYIRLNPVTDGGDLSQRFFRVQGVTREEREYAPVDVRRVVIQGNTVVVNDAGKKYVYFVRGDQLWLLPLDTTTDVEFRYSYYPPRFNSLTEGAYVSWPEGYEDAYTFEIAGRAMLKGGREDATALLKIGRDTLADLRSSITRPNGGPMMPYLHMTAQAWGGE